LSAFPDNFFLPELARRAGSAHNARKTHLFVAGATFGCFRFLVGPEKSGRAMKMIRVTWSVIMPVLMMVGWLSLYVMIFIEIGFL
jgi:hypothetical protein